MLKEQFAKGVPDSLQRRDVVFCTGMLAKMVLFFLCRCAPDEGEVLPLIIVCATKVGRNAARWVTRLERSFQHENVECRIHKSLKRGASPTLHQALQLLRSCNIFKRKKCATDD